MLGIDRLGYWAQPVRLRRADRDRPAGRGVRHRPDERSGSRTRSARRCSAARPTRRASARATTSSPRSSSSTPMRRSRTAGSCTSRRSCARSSAPDGKVVRPFEPKLIHKMDVPPERAADDARGRSQRGRRPAHLQPRRPADQGRGQVRYRRVRDARQPRATALPLLVCRVRPQGPGERQLRRSTTSELVCLAFAYDSRTVGNAATEIVKYFCSSTTASRRITATRASSSAATSTRATDAADDPSAASDGRDARLARDRLPARRRRGARSTSSSTTYAGLLVAIGLVMAYTNSVERATAAPGRDDVLARPDVGGDRNRGVPRRDRLRLQLAQDASPGRCTASRSACWC